MSSRTAAPWIEKLERFLEMKPPAMLPSQHWLYRIASVGFAFATLLAFLSAVFVETPTLTLLWFDNTLPNAILSGIFFGQGCYEGSFGRFGRGVHQTGRKLRAVAIVTLLAIFPFYCAIAAGSFGSIWGYGNVTGLLVGFVAGIAFMMIFVLLAVYRYWKTRRRYPQ